jgi:hypothetical protein
MDNSEIKHLIICVSAQTCGLITLWGLTNYFDKASDPEILMYNVNFLGKNMKLTTKLFYKITFLTSSVLCIVNTLNIHKARNK